MFVIKTEIKKNQRKCAWILLPPWRVGRVAGKKIPNPQVETTPLTANRNLREGQ